MKRVFQNINTKEKAYWLGFLYADGCMKKGKIELQLCLSAKDEVQIDNFISFMEGDVSYKRFYGPYKTSGKQVHYRVVDKDFYDDLISQGCKPLKKDTLTLKKFNNKELDLAFMLGYYDGNGDEGSTELTCGIEAFLKEIQAYFNIPYKTRESKNPYGTAYKLSLGIEFFIDMVKNYDGGLTRKRYIRNRKTPLNQKINRSFNRTEDNPKLLTLMIETVNASKSYSEAARKLGMSRNTIRKVKNRLKLDI